MLEETLERIAIALEQIAVTQSTAVAAVEHEYQPVQTPAPSASPVSPVPATIAPAPPTIPGAVPPGSLSPTAPEAPPAAAPLIPGGPAPSPAPVQAVPTLDDLRAAFNDFHRAHPDRVSEAYNIVLGAGVQKLDDIPPASYPNVLRDLKALGG